MILKNQTKALGEELDTMIICPPQVWEGIRASAGQVDEQKPGPR